MGTKRQIKNKKPEVFLQIFRAYDIRGLYGTELNSAVAVDIGKSLASYLDNGSKIALARDHRQSSRPLRDAFVKGALMQGLQVIDYGTIPTPILYYSIINQKLDGGTMITASHNPPDWNGFKLCKSGAEMISENHGMEEFKKIFTAKKFENAEEGKLTREFNAVNSYIRHIAKITKLERKIKVVIDSGNGEWSRIARKLFGELGCTAIEINGRPDPRYSARGTDPTESALSNLKKKVVKHSADFGVGYDADGDRATFVDDKGNYVGRADRIMSLFLLHLFGDTLAGKKVIYDVPCSNIVEDITRKLNGIPIISRTGHSYIMDKMKEESAVLGGEYSNHIYFGDNFNLDDGAFTSVKMAELLSKGQTSLSDLLKKLPIYHTVPVYEVYCSDEIKFKVVELVTSGFQTQGFKKIVNVDGVKVFSEDGWVLVRVSNTMPQIKINSEAKTQEAAMKLFETARKIVQDKIAEFD
ncbi:MAG: phosphomannomutase/phosphoglucomutase [Candidatus Micrarchaeota archaeon]|nr:phosphomannomutase/phosphoglucomutase [Candidatus Micrarchaeota archaeon]